VFWGRLVLADTFKWELHLQKRTQTSSRGSVNIFEAPHFISVWLWLSYKVSAKTKVSLSPIAYFNSHLFYNAPEEMNLKLEKPVFSLLCEHKPLSVFVADEVFYSIW